MLINVLCIHTFVFLCSVFQRGQTWHLYLTSTFKWVYHCSFFFTQYKFSTHNFELLCCSNIDFIPSDGDHFSASLSILDTCPFLFVKLPQFFFYIFSSVYGAKNLFIIFWWQIKVLFHNEPPENWEIIHIVLCVNLSCAPLRWPVRVPVSWQPPWLTAVSAQSRASVCWALRQWGTPWVWCTPAACTISQDNLLSM